MGARRARTTLDAVLIAGLGGNLDVLARVLDLLSEEAREDESAAVDHVEWASKVLEVHQQKEVDRETEEPGILRLCHYIRACRMWDSSRPVILLCRLRDSLQSDLIGPIC